MQVPAASATSCKPANDASVNQHSTTINSPIDKFAQNGLLVHCRNECEKSVVTSASMRTHLAGMGSAPRDEVEIQRTYY
jgi:hypothetical protein